MIDFFKSKKFQSSLTVMAIALWVIVPLWPSNLWPANQNTGYDPNANIAKHIQANSSLANTQNYSTNQNGSESSNADTQIQNSGVDSNQNIQNEIANLQLSIAQQQQELSQDLEDAKYWKSLISNSNSTVECPDPTLNPGTGAWGTTPVDGQSSDSYQQCLDSQASLTKSNNDLNKSYADSAKNSTDKANALKIEIENEQTQLSNLTNQR